MTRTIQLTVACLVALVASAGQVRAGTLLSQLPNQASGFFSNTGRQFSVAENFFLSTGTPGIGEITFWGGFFPTNTVPVPVSFDVRLMGASGGLPDTGNVFFSASSISPSSISDTGVDIFGVDEYRVTLSVTTGPLASGTYFLEMFGSGTDQWFWEGGTLDPTNGIAASAFASQTPGTTWILLGDDLSLVLNESNGTAPAVPEPSSLAIFGIGALGLVASGIRRRRKQRA